VQSGCFPVAGEASAMTSGDSFPQLGNPQMAGHGSECRDWAVIAASSPLALHNRFATFANGDHSNRNNNQNEEQFIEQKRRRHVLDTNRRASTTSAPAPATATTAGTASFGWAEAEAWPGNDDREVCHLVMLLLQR